MNLFGFCEFLSNLVKPPEPVKLKNGYQAIFRPFFYLPGCYFEASRCVAGALINAPATHLELI